MRRHGRRARAILIVMAVAIGAFLATSTGWADVYPGSIFNLSFRHTTYKPMLHGKSWMAVTGEPLSVMAGAKIFEKGGTPWTPPLPCWRRSA